MKGKIKHIPVLACLLLLPTALLVLLQACKKDLGNYHYADINQVQISGISADSLVIMQGDTLNINVNIQQTNASGNLSYHWYLVQAIASNANPTQFLLDSGQNLHARITARLGAYNVVDKVTDLKTGVSFYKYFTLQVRPSLSAGEGWLVLQDESASSNGSDISIILSRDGTTHGAVYNDLYYAANGRKLPLGTNYMNVLNYNSSLNIQKLVFGYPGGGTQVRATDYSDSSYATSWFFVPPASVNVQKDAAVNNGGTEIIVNNNQISYAKVNASTVKTPPILFGAPIIGSWTVSPYMLQFEGLADYYMTMYDTANQCFFLMNTSSNALVPALPDVPNAHFANYGGSAAALLATGTGFDLNHIGKRLLYAENIQPITYSNTAVYWDCFFRSNTMDSTYVIQLTSYLSYNNNISTGRYYLNPVKCPGINSATLFACPTYLNTPGVFYYTNGSNIYTCSVSTVQGASTASVGYAFPAGTVIKAMRTLRTDYSGPGTAPKTPFPATEGKVLVVATDETAAGNGNNVYFFNLGPTGQIALPYSDKYSGFNSIVDIRFKKLIGL